MLLENTCAPPSGKKWLLFKKAVKNDISFPIFYFSCFTTHVHARTYVAYVFTKCSTFCKKLRADHICNLSHQYSTVNDKNKKSHSFNHVSVFSVNGFWSQFKG